MKPRKLSTTAFAQAIAQGAGCAFLHVKEYGDQDVRQELLNACLHNLIYDKQIDPSRANWLASILDHTEDIGFYAEAIKNALRGPLDDDWWCIEQLLAMASCLFARGFAEFRPVVFELANREINADNVYELCKTLVDVAGYTGFEFAARKLVESDQEGSNEWEMRELFDYASTALDRYVVEFLEEAAPKDESLHQFWNTVQKNIEDEKNSPPHTKPPVKPVMSDNMNVRLARSGSTTPKIGSAGCLPTA